MGAGPGFLRQLGNVVRSSRGRGLANKPSHPRFAVFTNTACKVTHEYNGWPWEYTQVTYVLIHTLAIVISPRSDPAPNPLLPTSLSVLS